MQSIFFMQSPENMLKVPSERQQENFTLNCRKAAEVLIDTNIIKSIFQNLSKLSFEGKKSVELVFGALVKNDYSNFVSDYLNRKENAEIIPLLVEGYGTPSIALVCGGMLRALIKYDQPTDKAPFKIMQQIITRKHVDMFFHKFLHDPNFDVSSDAFNTFKMIT